MAFPALSCRSPQGACGFIIVLLIGKQTLNLLDIGLVGIGGHAQASLELGRLLVEDVASFGRIALDFSVPCQLKSLFCTGVRFDFRHMDSPLSVISESD